MHSTCLKDVTLILLEPNLLACPGQVSRIVLAYWVQLQNKSISWTWWTDSQPLSYIPSRDCFFILESEASIKRISLTFRKERIMMSRFEWEMSPPHTLAQGFEQLVLSWWCCLGRFWNLRQKLWWRKYVIEGRQTSCLLSAWRLWFKKWTLSFPHHPCHLLLGLPTMVDS